MNGSFSILVGAIHYTSIDFGLVEAAVIHGLSASQQESSHPALQLFVFRFEVFANAHIDGLV